MTARGDRLNNPLNLRLSGDKWQGAADVQSDAEFVEFKSIEYGFRAAARNLLTYEKRAWNTVAEICAHWAPPEENDTPKYIADICDWTGFADDEILDLDSAVVMLPLLRAMARKEQGKTYKDAVILEGMRMAGVHDAAPKSIVKQPAAQAVSVATIGGAVAGAGEVARQLREVQDTAQTGIDFIHFLTSYGMGVAIALVVIGGCGALYAMWRKQNRTGG